MVITMGLGLVITILHIIMARAIARARARSMVITSALAPWFISSMARAIARA